MGFLDKLMGRDAPGEVAPVAEVARQDYLVETVRPFIDRPALNAAGLRSGMWVMTSEGIGIITGCQLGGIAEVTLAKPDGTTRMTLSADDKAVPHVVLGDVTTLEQACVEDIVALHSGSRPAPDPESLLVLGYKRRGAA